MSNIQHITIRGFQSHVNSVIEFGKGLNVITGPSDSGKTAVLRALRWLAFNEPTGEAFVNESVGEAQVEVLLENGTSIMKQRRKGKTSYHISTIDEPFEKAEVPEEVKALLGITKHSFGDFETSLNFAFQLEAPFLISETGSVGAKVLGKLAGTEVIDMTTKAVSKETFAARQERGLAEKEIERIDGDLVEYENLELLKEQLEASSYLIDQLDEAVKRKDNMTQLSVKYHNLLDQQEALNEKLDRLAIVPTLDEDLQNIEKAQQHYDTLLGLYSQFNRQQEAVATLSETLATYNHLDEASDLVTETVASNQTLTSFINLNLSYQNYSDKVVKSSRVLQELEEIPNVEALVNQTIKDDQRLTKLENLFLQYSRIASTIKQVNETLEKTNEIEDLEDLVYQAEESMGRLQQLKQTEERYTSFENRLATFEAQLTATANLSDAEDYLNQSVTSYATLQELQKVNTTNTVKQTHLEHSTKLYQEAEGEYQEAQTELDELWQEVDVCPLCEQLVTEHAHSH